MDIKPLHKQASIIGACLNGFRYDQRSINSDWAILIHESGGLICLKQDWRNKEKIKARVAVKWDSNRFLDFKLLSGEIGFSLNRPANNIAKDITKRLLPEALKQWVNEKEQNKKQQQKELILRLRSENLEHFMPELEKLSYCHSEIARDTGNSYSFEKNKITTLVHLSAFEDKLNLKMTNVPDNLAYQLMFLIKSHEPL